MTLLLEGELPNTREGGWCGSPCCGCLVAAGVGVAADAEVAVVLLLVLPEVLGALLEAPGAGEAPPGVLSIAWLRLLLLLLLLQGAAPVCGRVG